MALHSPGLVDLIDAAASPAARPSAAQLLPGTAAAEGLRHFERALLAASDAGPRELTSAAAMLLRAGGKRVRPLLTLLAARAAAPAAGAPAGVSGALREFGQRAGCAFQITDDLLDFDSDAATLGKAVLADVVEGKPSLPLAIALKRLPPLRAELAQLLAANVD